MVCEECGETNKPGTEFCLFCGAYLGWQGSTTQTLPAQPAVPAADPAPPAAPTPTRPAQRQPVPVAPIAPAASLPPAPSTHDRPAQPPPQRPGPVAPAPAAAVPSPAEPAAPVAPRCPRCGRPVEEGRRFCRCGQQLAAPPSQATTRARRSARLSWWDRLWDSKDRSARRAYRRSLPWFYRWRRVLITVLTLGLLGGGVVVIGGRPKEFVIARYYDLRGTTVALQSVTPVITPPEGSDPDTPPQALVDATGAAWSMRWTADTRGTACGPAPGTPVIEMTFAPTRIRAIDFRGGLLAADPDRNRQFRPREVGVVFGEGPCQTVTLQDLEFERIKIDSRSPVTTVRIGVQSAHPSTVPDGVDQRLSFTEITLRSRPPLR